MKKELIVVQKNSFIRGNFSFLEVRDIKILKLLVSKVNATNKEFESYYYITKDEVRAFEFNERNLHSYIKTSLRKLGSVFIVVKNDDNEEVEVSLVGKIIYDKKNGIYKVPLSSDLKAYLLDIKKEFTKYKIENLVKLKQKEEIKLYEFLKSISFEVFVVSIEKLKNIMELNHKSYQLFFNFNKKLKQSIKSINYYTDVQVEIKVLKKNNQSCNIQFFLKKYQQLESPKITIEVLLNNYKKKHLILKEEKFIIEDIKKDNSFIIVIVFSKSQSLTGKLKFSTLDDCHNYLIKHTFNGS